MNLGSGVETTAIDLAKMINRVTGNTAGVSSISKRSWDKGSRRLASIEKAKKILGYNPKTKLEDGLIKVNEWFIENKERIVFLEQ